MPPDSEEFHDKIAIDKLSEVPSTPTAKILPLSKLYQQDRTMKWHDLENAQTNLYSVFGEPKGT